MSDPFASLDPLSASGKDKASRNAAGNGRLGSPSPGLAGQPARTLQWEAEFASDRLPGGFPPGAWGAAGAATSQQTEVFNPVTDDENPFLEDVCFQSGPFQPAAAQPSAAPAAVGPTQSFGTADAGAGAGADPLAGFDDFVSDQLKRMNMEPSAPALALPGAGEQPAISGASLLPDIPAAGNPGALAPGGAESREDTRTVCNPLQAGSKPELPEPPTWGGERLCEVPVPFVTVRPRPPQRSVAGTFQAIAGGDDFLVAGPTEKGGLRMWLKADGSLDCAKPSWGRSLRYARESSGACKSVDIPSECAGHVSCLVVDGANAKVWAGFSSGHVSCWDASSLLHEHTWQAHRGGGVHAMVLTHYGDLWTGSSRGSLRLWRDAGKRLPRSIADSVELRRSNGERAHGRVIALSHAENSGKVWSCGNHHLALWDAATGEFKNYVGEMGKEALGALESTYDMSWSGRRAVSRGGMDGEPDFSGYTRTNSNLSNTSSASASSTVTRKASSYLGWGVKAVVRSMDRGTKAIYGAHTGGQGGVEAVSTGLVVAAACDGAGNVWVSYKNGRIEVYSGEGATLQKWKEAWETLCLCAVGDLVWSGTSAGEVVVWGQTFDVRARWKAHACPVLGVRGVGDRVFTLAADGGVCAWHCRSALDWREDSAAAILQRHPELVEQVPLKCFAGTWNVNMMKAGKMDVDEVSSWLGSGVAEAQLAVVGLQEIEMGGRSVAESLVKEAFAKGSLEKGNQTAQAWLNVLTAALFKATKSRWVRVGSRQLSGMLIGVYVREEIKDAVGEVSTCSVARGVMGVGGNKGTVAVSMVLHGRRVLLLCSHFAAHHGAVAERNEDFRNTVKGLKLVGEAGDPGEGSLFRDAELVVWVGDFNYRVDLDYEGACTAAYGGHLDVLRERDQLLRERDKGNTFVGFLEGRLEFAPTYKFDKNSSRYDTSEKQRIPAWCDRVFYKGSTGAHEIVAGYGPLASKLAGAPRLPVACALEAYGSCHGIESSDHKPVYAVLSLSLCRVNQALLRDLSLQAFASLAQSTASPMDALQVRGSAEAGESPTGGPGSRFWLCNQGSCPLAFRVSSRERFSNGFFSHLVSISPVVGVLGPGAEAEVAVGVNSGELERGIHRLDQVELHVGFWAPFAKGGDRASKDVDIPLHYERYFNSM